MSLLTAEGLKRALNQGGRGGRLELTLSGNLGEGARTLLKLWKDGFLQLERDAVILLRGVRDNGHHKNTVLVTVAPTETFNPRIFLKRLRNLLAGIKHIPRSQARCTA